VISRFTISRYLSIKDPCKPDQLGWKVRMYVPLPESSWSYDLGEIYNNYGFGIPIVRLFPSCFSYRRGSALFRDSIACGETDVRNPQL
jgi:hypothetical protein